MKTPPRIYNALMRNMGRWPYAGHSRSPESEADVLQWANERTDRELALMRNIGPDAIAWIRSQATDESSLPFGEASPEAAISTAKPRRHRHAYQFTVNLDGMGGTGFMCPCGAIQDPAASRRGKSAARLGKDQERAFEREHGPTKIGERGDPVDHLGRFGKYQVKSTRGAVPARLRHIDRMEGLYGDRVPILVERFVRHGVRTETFLTMRLKDWQAVHGRDEE